MSATWAVVPVKELAHAKQRLSPYLPPALRQALMQVMIGEVLDALVAVRGLEGILLVTVDPWATGLAARLGLRVLADGAREGHTGSVLAAARILAWEGRRGMITMPGDVPAATATEIEAVLGTHSATPAFTIAPAHDELGSNAVLISPPLAVPLRFGEDSYFPHLAAARAAGIAPGVVRLPGIGMDIDHPADFASFARLPQAQGTRTLGFLQEQGLA